MDVNMENMEKDNRNAGFTMMELLLVSVIMAVMVGASVVGFNLLNQGDSKKAVKNISSQLAELRTNTLSMAGEWKAEIYKDGGTYKLDILKGADVISTSSIGSRIVISFDDSENAPYEITDSSKVVISFLKGNGKVDDVVDNAGNTLEGLTSKSGAFIVTPKSSSTSTTLTLWYLTGKVTTEY